MRLVELLRHLLAPVEDGAVSAGAQHVLVQRALTPLTLRPQLTCRRVWKGGGGGDERGMV